MVLLDLSTRVVVCTVSFFSAVSCGAIACDRPYHKRRVPYPREPSQQGPLQDSKNRGDGHSPEETHQPVTEVNYRPVGQQMIDEDEF